MPISKRLKSLKSQGVNLLVFGLELDSCLVKFMIWSENVHDFLAERILGSLPFKCFFFQVELLDLGGERDVNNV